MRMRFTFCKDCQKPNWARRRMFLWRCIDCGRACKGPDLPRRSKPALADSGSLAA